MIRSWICVFLVFCAVFLNCQCQQYDFAAEITRQCLVPDPVGLLDCVENKVTLPYLTSWVDCTNSLGENVKTSADIINYRCKSVWEGKGVIPEVFYIKDCVIEKTGLPAKNVSAEVLGAYKECESTPNSQQQRTKTAPVQQQQIKASFVQYNPPTQQIQTPAVLPPQQTIQARAPVQQVQNQPLQPQMQMSFQQPQAPLFQPPQQQMQMTFQQAQSPLFQQTQQQIPMQMQVPMQQSQPSMFSQPQNIPRQQFMQQRVPQMQPQQFTSMQRPVQQQIQVAAPRPMQQQMQVAAPRPMQQQMQVAAPRPMQQQMQVAAPRPMQQQMQVAAPRPIQQQMQVAAPRPFQQAPARSFTPVQQAQMRPVQTPQVPISPGSQYPSTVSSSANLLNQRQPQSQQYFVIYPQAPLPNQQQSLNQQQNSNQPISSRKTASSPVFTTQQQVAASAQQSSFVNLQPYSYSVQINHPLRSSF